MESQLSAKLERPAPFESEDPFELQQHSGATQSTGWIGAWKATPSTMAVAAHTPDDVAAAVRFAAEHDLRVVIKGTGHDYLGRSNAPGSLLIWTHAMRAIEMHDAFVARGCSDPGTPAVSVQAGVRWGEAYRKVTVENGRYVQGGGCTSVGAAGGFIQGGGFGTFSKKYGTGAAGMLEAEVVTADGRVLIANRCQNQDLFWALRGGGGGSFGAVTRATLRTHALPSTFGGVFGTITASSDPAYEELLARFIRFYRESLSNENWGEQVHLRQNNTLGLSMLSSGIGSDQMQEIWRPFREWIESRAQDFSLKIDFVEVPPRGLWDPEFLEKNVPGVSKRSSQDSLFYWAQNQEEVAAFWYAYQSRWLPLSLFDSERELARVFFQASRQWNFALHFNKGQAGAAEEAVARGRETSMNPAVFRAAALVIIAAHGQGTDPDLAHGEKEKARVAAAMKPIREATPGAGSYVNETDYFEPNWQVEFWGENYGKLLELKTKYDPEGLFYCHHCVGSERWSNDGMCRRAPLEVERHR